MHPRYGAARVAIAAFAVVLLASAASAAEGRKVVFLGFDGADGNLTRQWMEEGHLPNLRALAESGSYTLLEPANPPQTPVSWSTFATGWNPGRTEMFDFVRRAPGTYSPTFGLNEPARASALPGWMRSLGGKRAALRGVGIALVILGLGSFYLLLRSGGAVRVLLGAVLAAALVAAGSFATFGVADVLPDEKPWVVNLRKGVPFWEIAADAGREVEIVRVAATFPPRSVPGGRVLAGLGVPDIQGSVGSPTFYYSDPLFYPDEDRFSMQKVPLRARSGVVETRITGPSNESFFAFVIDRRARAWRDEGIPEDEIRTRQGALAERLRSEGVQETLTVPLRLEADPGEGTLAWETSGQRGVLREGEWSDWIRLRFPVNWLMDRLEPVEGIARLRLISVRDEIRLYLTPVSFHPDCHPVPYASPADWSGELADDGLYKTMGWAVDTWAINNGVADEDMFLEDMWFTVDRYERFLDDFLADPEADLFVQVFYFIDRTAHVFWHHLDPGHPLHDPDRAARYAPEILATYQRMDAMVGKTLERLGDRAVVLVGSDHGFSSFRRQMNLNSWLVDNGYMTLEAEGGEAAPPTLDDLDAPRKLFRGVDWERTRAYALGLGSLYVNRLGREPEGIVEPGETERALLEEIRRGLLAYRDPDTGDAPVRRVYERTESYPGPLDRDLVPDLRVAYNHNYRVAWQGTLGAIEPEICFDNDRVWSGDHATTDPSLVPGILFSTRPLAVDDPAIIDLAPTILALLGLTPPDGMEGRDLFAGATTASR